MMNVRALRGCVILAALGMGAVGARAPQNLSLPQAPNPEIKLTPAEIELYKSAPTLIDWTPSQIHHSPYLHNLRSAQSQDQLPGILERVGQTCARNIGDFLNVTCDEEVVSRGSASYSRVARDFHYIVIRRPIGDLPAFEEYRTDRKGNLVNSASYWDFSMITRGFASSWLFFSPADQHDNRYRYLGIQTIRNRECQVVGFAQDPERARYLWKFDSQGTRFSLMVQGLAWIDAQTFQILRTTTWLLAPRKDIGLSSQTSTVDFYAVRPTGTEKELWLPREVRVETLFRGHKVRNTHQYSNYKLFRVESTIKPGP
jgi:hypothetical protein